MEMKFPLPPDSARHRPIRGGVTLPDNCTAKIRRGFRCLPMTDDELAASCRTSGALGEDRARQVFPQRLP
jgi:hypothetical protein